MNILIQLLLFLVSFLFWRQWCLQINPEARKAVGSSSKHLSIFREMLVGIQVDFMIYYKLWTSPRNTILTRESETGTRRALASMAGRRDLPSDPQESPRIRHLHVLLSLKSGWLAKPSRQDSLRTISNQVSKESSARVLQMGTFRPGTPASL